MRLFGGFNEVNNELYINNFKVSDIASKYKTPLYIYDESLVRKNIREFRDSFCIGNENIVAYAGKSFLVPYMCKILKEEGAYLDVVSGGELYVAKHSDFPMEKVIFHGNNKTKEEITMGIEYGVGRFVVDNFRELNILSSIAKSLNKNINVLIRVAPGVDANTHEYIKTGNVDTKFGFSTHDREYLQAAKKCIEYDNINFMGIHAHIGSQICESSVYQSLSFIMVEIAKEIKNSFDYQIEEIDLGGGFGVYYNDQTTPLDFKEYPTTILNAINLKCSELGINIKRLIIEPGRSIIANPCITVYKVGSIKDITGVRKYVAVDGGMTDNIRPALYRARYEALIVNNIHSDDNEEITICGKCCESGDILIKDISLPKVKENDLLAIMSTGAYCYSMSSNYNMALIPSVVFVDGNVEKLVCKRQEYDDLVRNCINI